MFIRYLFIGLIFMTFVKNSASQISVLPDNKEILYSGRISFADPLNPTFSMSASGFKVNIVGSALVGRFSSEGGNSYLYVVVDGKANPYDRNIIEVNSDNENTYVIAENLSVGPHSVEIIKLNESYTKVTFHGIIISGDGLLPKPLRPKLKLEFIGDSNTAGWSAWDAYDVGGNEYSESYFSFPGITAHLLDAEYSLIGGSSSGVTDKAMWNLSSAYDKIHLRDSYSELNQWDFKDNYWGFIPDAVIINLGANDYYGKASKTDIINGWKSFIENKIRVIYPKTHIVLVNSYGWAYNEPADYVNEVVAYFLNKGDDNVSHVLFPWLWGQTHAVINEHAGFANIIATHLAKELNLPQPEASTLSSFMNEGEVYNGGFEKSLIDGVADGWRPHGKCHLISNDTSAFEGNNFIRLHAESWINHPVFVKRGMILNLSSFVRSDKSNPWGYLTIEFKDQGQKTIQSKQLLFKADTIWKKKELIVQVPDNVWSAWIVLKANDRSVIDIDQIDLSHDNQE